MDVVSSPGIVRASPDLDLASRCASGDRQAQRELFDREVDHVHATLYRILGPNRDIEDLVQDVFIEIFRSLGSYRGEAKLSTWTGRVTAHVAYGYLSSKRPPAVWLESVPEPEAPGPTAERRAMARAAMRQLYAMMAELEPATRLAFTLHALDGQPLDEVARAMRATVVATKSRVWRARRRMRRDPSVAALLSGALTTSEREDER
jgi:RNA polymerase sigma-70 factor (ECF subfamily)